jgi:hypothetical protein
VADPAGTSVTVPPDALSSTIMIGVTRVAGDAMTGTMTGAMPALPTAVRPAGEVFALTPHGVTFNQPVQLHVGFDATLAARAAGRPLQLYTAAPDGSWTVVPGGQVTDDAVEATVSHFSFFVVGFELPVQSLPELQPRKVDILFMIDDSQSMLPLQQKLAASFPALIQTLKNLPGGLPDVHLGVVSSTMGPGRFDLPQYHCAAGGDRGVLQNIPRGTCLTAIGDRYISATENEVTRNYDGTIEDAFSCIALLGDQGCGFEQQLESVAVALGARGTPPPENAGFLRDDALLSIVLITNEDDCSLPADSDLVDITSMYVSDPLGPLWSYRCNEYGHICDGGPPPRTAADPSMPAPVTLNNCRSAEDGRLNRISEYAQLFKALKPDPAHVYLTVIAAPPTPYVVEWIQGNASLTAPDPSLWPNIQHSCTVNTGEFGDPAVRLAQLVTSFGANGNFSSICDDFAPALTGVGAALTRAMDLPCLQAALLAPGATPALVPGCNVYESLPATGGTRTETRLPACGPTVTADPCWVLQTTAACTPSDVAISLQRTTSPPAGAAIVVRCGP